MTAAQSRRLTIWLLQTGEPAPLGSDVRRLRTGLLAEQLAARGHDVQWWTGAFEHQSRQWLPAGEAPLKLASGVTLRPLRGLGYQRNVSPRRYLDDVLVARRFRSKAPHEKRPDVIVASIPSYHLAYEAARLARRWGTPFIVDIRDPWPHLFPGLMPRGPLRVIVRALLWNDFRRHRVAVSRADSLVAVSAGFLNHARSVAARPARPVDRVFMIGADATRLESPGKLPREDAEWLARQKGKKIFVFLGTFGRSYELELIVRTARRLLARGRDDIAFVIAGRGDQEKAIAKQARDLPNVRLPGWVDGPQIAAWMRAAYAGLVACRSAPDTLPNKPFEYLAGGLPLVSSLEGELETLIERTAIGVNYRPGDDDGFEQAILLLADDPARREIIAGNAARFFAAHGDSRMIYQAYADHVEAIACRIAARFVRAS